MASSRRPIVVSGPSGGGKSTILNRAMREYPNAFAFSVSHTTRSPRPGERDGVHYHFITREKMQAMINNGEFLEHAEFGGNLYGTSKAAVKAVQETGRICVLDIELQGVRNVHNSNLNARFIFLQPPSVEVLEQRLRGRNTESEESLQRRLERARADLQAEPHLFDVKIVNDDLETAYKQFIDFLGPDLKQA